MMRLVAEYFGSHDVSVMRYRRVVEHGYVRWLHDRRAR